MGDRVHVKRPRPVVRVEGVVVPQMVVCVVAVPYGRVEVFATIPADVDLFHRDVDR